MTVRGYESAYIAKGNGKSLEEQAVGAVGAANVQSIVSGS